MLLVDAIKQKSLFLKSIVSLAQVTAKQHFLKVCWNNKLLPEALGKESALEDLRVLEDTWRTRLESWAPGGLNIKED